jgi:hypothetical protein
MCDLHLALYMFLYVCCCMCDLHPDNEAAKSWLAAGSSRQPEFPWGYQIGGASNITRLLLVSQ